MSTAPQELLNDFTPLIRPNVIDSRTGTGIPASERSVNHASCGKCRAAMIERNVYAASLLLVAAIAHVGCTGSSTQNSAPNIKAPVVASDSLVNRFHPLLGESIHLASDEQLHEWLSERWGHFADEGPLQHLPKQRSYSDRPWPDSATHVYVGLYPPGTASNVLDFEVFNWYTSSLQQDLIRDGNADLQYFYAEEKEDGVLRLMNFLRSSSVLIGNDLVIAKLRSVRLPKEMGWVYDLKYKSAIVGAGSDGIEMVAESEDGYLTVIAVDG